MIGKSPDIFTDIAVKIYNEDKIPASEINRLLGERMMDIQFQELKKAFQMPYTYKISLEKFVVFNIRYKHIMARCQDIIDRIRFYRNIQNKIKESPDLPPAISPFKRGNKNKPVTLQEHYEELEQRIINQMIEFKRWWYLKQMYMNKYTKTAKYKRLQLINKLRRQRIREEGEAPNIWTKQNIIKKRMNYLQKRHKVWSSEDDIILSS